MDNNFCALYRVLREESRITLKQASNGLCSISMLSHIEKGIRQPDYLLRTRLIDRLGISTAGIINYLQPGEYEVWLKKNLIITCLKKEEFDTTRYLIEELKKYIQANDKVSLQFVNDIFGLMAFYENNIELALEQYNKAVDLTMVGIGSDNLNEYAISPVEYYLLVMRLKCKAKLDRFDNVEIKNEYESIIRHIDSKAMDIEIKARIYPLVVTSYYSFLHTNQENITHTLYEAVDRAINLLIKCEKTYYIIELLKAKLEIAKSEKKDDCICADIENIIQELEKVFDILDISYKKIHICYLYEDENCQNIANIVRNRRLLNKYTQIELSDGICSTKTLRRIEQGTVDAQDSVIKPLLKKLCLPEGYQFGEIITSNRNILALARKFRTALIEHNNFLQDDYIKELEILVDDRLPQNRQVMIRNQLLRDKQCGNISYKDYCNEIERAIACTIDFKNIINYEGGYVTESEIECIYAYACEALKNGDNTSVSRFKCFFERLIADNNPIRQPFESLITRWLSAVYAEEKDYEKSDYYAEISAWQELKCHRIRVAYQSIYDIAWNGIQKYESEAANSKYCETLHQCRCISKFYKDEKAATFFEQKLIQVT